MNTDRPRQPPRNSAPGPAAGALPPVRSEKTEENRPATWGTGTARLDDWLTIAPDGMVTVYTGKVELGTGVRTALTQIVADELDVPIEHVHMVMGDTERTPNEGYTAGSKTIRMGGKALRDAAAEARRALIEMAATRFGVPVDALVARAGAVVVESDPTHALSYGELIGGKSFDRQVTGAAPYKSPRDYRIVGTDTPRLDLPDKFSGGAPFIQNLRLPGMLHARVVRPHPPTATLVALDDSAVSKARVVRRGNFVAVVAEDEFDAMRAVGQLRLTWQETAAAVPMGDPYTWMRAQPTRDQVVTETGNVQSALDHAATRVRAAYYQPFQAHASIGPACAVAEFRDGTLVVWCSSQGVFQLRGALADMLAMPAERIQVVFVDGSGCYGHNGADDAAADAAVLACELAGQPVRVQWSREDEFIWEPKGPAMIMEHSAGLDVLGSISAWDSAVWTPTHANRPRRALDLIAGQLIQGATGQPAPAFFLGGDRNAPTNYSLPNARVTLHWLARMPSRHSSLRSLGATANTFANESFMDELATAAGADPLAFRLRHLDDPRARAVLTAATERAGWGGPLPRGEGLGLAFARYENDEAYVATVAHVRVDATTGDVRLLRVVVAHDCGLIINPNGLRNQIEGNVIQAASRALKEEVLFDETGITSQDWSTYPILTFTEVPEIDIVLINRPEEPAVGAGEPATITTAPAIANAIFAASGARVRQVPFSRTRVRAALAAPSAS